jgi:hypothetical protein
MERERGGVGERGGGGEVEGKMVKWAKIVAIGIK